MSTPSSPPPSASYVPYQAYKSKRHSRNLSNPNAHLVPNQSPPPLSRPPSGPLSPAALLQPPKLVLSGEDDLPSVEAPSARADAASPSPSVKKEYIVTPPAAGMAESAVEEKQALIKIMPDSGPSSSASTPANSTTVPGHSEGYFPVPASPGTSSMKASTPKKTSTFRRLPPKTSRNVQPLTHSRAASFSSIPPRLTDSPHKQAKSPVESPVVSPAPRQHIPLPPPPKIQESASYSSRPSTASTPQILPIDSPSILQSPSTSTAGGSDASVQDQPIRPSAPRKSAPYRPGFQPKGVYRPLTDDFLEIRRAKRDGDGEGGISRVERTKLERRLEKLIALHFPLPGEEKQQEKVRPGIRPLANGNKRPSSIFDLGSFKNININDAGELWRGVVSGNLMDSSKNDIRAAEQRITPWQEDAEVTKCPLCVTSFHPLTSRKHHCRLCGRIVCSLPIKHPQRPALCSVLFVVDKQTRQIEEVSEGVDYGVRKRRVSGVAGQQAKQEEEEKFLKGVRICRECRPVLLKQQYRQQAQIIPPFADLYQQFIGLEADIEEALPKFQELVMSLNHHDHPTKDASAARKRLLDSFSLYDKLAKRIRSLPCPSGPGSSQDRVQMAISTRANLFLQKNLIPLQSISTARPNGKTAATSKINGTETSNLPRDMEASLAHALQPLLEQESLLEVFVEEAQAQRKFEDVKTLKLNLNEIRKEIERLLDASDAQR